MQTFPVDSYMERSNYEDMDYWLVKKFYGPEVELNDIVTIHVVRKPGTVIPNFSTHLHRSHIFLPDKPSDVRGIRQFYLLHVGCYDPIHQG